jgi:hypothetical protein
MLRVITRLTSRIYESSFCFSWQLIANQILAAGLRINISLSVALVFQRERVCFLIMLLVSKVQATDRPSGVGNVNSSTEC